jgi:dynein intermediate chain
MERINAHFGPVTAIAIHSQIPHCFLTSSVDWTCKLWNYKVERKQRDRTLNKLSTKEKKVVSINLRLTLIHSLTHSLTHSLSCIKSSTKPIHCLDDFGDYVYDVRWSPKHPALFATVDGTGTLSLWNLNKQTEVRESLTSIIDWNCDVLNHHHLSIIKILGEPFFFSFSLWIHIFSQVALIKRMVSDKALSRLVWNTNGNKILTGDTAAKLYLIDIAEEVAAPADSGHELRQFEETLAMLESHSRELNTNIEESGV